MEKTTTDLIKSMVNDKPVEAVDAFTALMQDKVDSLIADKAVEINQTLFATKETENVES